MGGFCVSFKESLEGRTTKISRCVLSTLHGERARNSEFSEIGIHKGGRNVQFITVIGEEQFDLLPVPLERLAY